MIPTHITCVGKNSIFDGVSVMLVLASIAVKPL